MAIATTVFSIGSILCLKYASTTNIFTLCTVFSILLALGMSVMILVMTGKQSSSFEEKSLVGSQLIKELQECSDEYAYYDENLQVDVDKAMTHYGLITVFSIICIVLTAITCIFYGVLRAK